MHHGVWRVLTPADVYTEPSHKVASRADPPFWPREVERRKGASDGDGTVTRYILLYID